MQLRAQYCDHCAAYSVIATLFVLWVSHYGAKGYSSGPTWVVGHFRPGRDMLSPYDAVESGSQNRWLTPFTVISAAKRATRGNIA